MGKKLAQSLINYVKKSPSAFHAVDEAKNFLNKHNFIEIFETEKWNLEANGKYYVTKNDSSIFAFIIGSGEVEANGFKIIGSHTDSPGFKIKPNPEIYENSYLKLNIEVYGGPIIETWFDRPLGIAGRVALKSDNSMKPEIKLVNINKPALIIPNLAIHLGRESKNSELNRQTDILPVVGLLENELEKNNYLLNLISKELNVESDNILDFELYLYEYENGTLAGINEEFISCAKIDNLASLHSSLKALVDSKESNSTKVIACFDNEEIGSSTKQGADSPTLIFLLERIALTLGKDREEFFRSLANSFIVSADGAHALHPNFQAKSDPVNKSLINKGPTIKISARQSYTSDAFSASVIKSIALDHNIPVQYFVNRSDIRGGSTIGPISSTNLPIQSVDIGLPMLAMHSIREMCGVDDYSHLTKLLTNFFSL